MINAEFNLEGFILSAIGYRRLMDLHSQNILEATMKMNFYQILESNYNIYPNYKLNYFFKTIFLDVLAIAFIKL